MTLIYRIFGFPRLGMMIKSNLENPQIIKILVKTPASHTTYDTPLLA
jgi:hypothetical protein